jgi:hypothetical protein
MREGIKVIVGVDDLEQKLETRVNCTFAEVKQNMPERLVHERAKRAGFEERLYIRWKNALDLFEMIMFLVLEAGVNCNQKYSQLAAQEKDIVFDTLLRLHARTCHTASEVRVLLFSGHATAALARWRTLHEIAVVCYLIRDHGRDIAERYLFHDTIEAVKAGEEYQKYSARLGHIPLTDNELAERRNIRDNLLLKYGQAFGRSYGWAAQALGNNNPTFSDLEQAANLDHMRPYYRMASHGVHSNPKGITFTIEHPGPKEVMIASASMFGLADPGHATLLSLLQCTSVLLLNKQDEQAIVTLSVLERLVDEAGQAFLDTHKQIEYSHEEDRNT